MHISDSRRINKHSQVLTIHVLAFNLLCMDRRRTSCLSDANHTFLPNYTIHIVFNVYG
jgi:hypothetical protein